MERIRFIDSPQNYFDGSVFVAHLTGIIKSKKQLLNSLSESLHFPGYFGHNWAALFDCLRDFEWINQRGVVLVHDNFPQLDEIDLKNYIEILVEATKDWKLGESHYFEVIFPDYSKELIEKYL